MPQQGNCPVGPLFAGILQAVGVRMLILTLATTQAPCRAYLTGEDITIAGLKVRDSQVALANQAYFHSQFQRFIRLSFPITYKWLPGHGRHQICSIHLHEL